MTGQIHLSTETHPYNLPRKPEGSPPAQKVDPKKSFLETAKFAKKSSTSSGSTGLTVVLNPNRQQARASTSKLPAPLLNSAPQIEDDETIEDSQGSTATLEEEMEEEEDGEGQTPRQAVEEVEEELLLPVAN
ncbi:hypothetical protein JCM5350_000565, partial [Sporobolomyces pararoseus]